MQLCLLGSLLPVPLGSGCCWLPSPASPSDGKANLPAFQTFTGWLLLCSCCLWPAGARKSSELKAGRSWHSRMGEVEFALLCQNWPGSALGPWIWVHLASARSVLWEGSTWVPSSVSVVSLSSTSDTKDSLNSFLSRGKDCD